jgi:hypothetical protein
MNKMAKIALIMVIGLNAFTATLLVMMTVKALRFNPADWDQKDLAELAKTMKWLDGHRLFPAIAGVMSFTTYFCLRVLASTKKDESKRG